MVKPKLKPNSKLGPLSCGRVFKETLRLAISSA
jgi:hypothetical protein